MSPETPASRTRKAHSMELTRRSALKTGALGLGAIGAMALAGCSDSGTSGGTASGKANLTMVVWGGDADKKAYQSRIDLFHKANPGIHVDLQLIPAAQYPQKVQTMISGGTGPDIMQVAEDVNTYSSKSQLIPLDQYVKSAGFTLRQRFGSVGDIYSYQGKVYAIPDRSGAMITFYNKDLFKKAGVPHPTASWNWTDAENAMEKLTVTGKQWGWAGAGWWPQWWSLVYQNGGRIIDSKGKPTINSSAAVDALQWINDLTWNKHYIPTAAEYADMGPNTGGDQAFLAGKVAMNTTGFWDIGMLLKSDFEWDIAPFWHGKEKAVSAFGSGLAITRNCKSPDAAFKAISFLTDAKAQKVIIDQGEDVPANLAVQKSDALLHPNWESRGIDMGVFAQSSNMIYRPPFISQWNEMQNVFTSTMTDWWNKGGDTRTMLDATQKQLESVISGS